MCVGTMPLGISYTYALFVSQINMVSFQKEEERERQKERLLIKNLMGEIYIEKCVLLTIMELSILWTMGYTDRPPRRGGRPIQIQAAV